jgi:hypothetical protein
MITSELIVFPAIGFDHKNRASWFSCGRSLNLRADVPVPHFSILGALLVDSNGQSWEIISVEKLGRYGSFWQRVGQFIERTKVYKVKTRIEPRGPVSFEDLRERICASIIAHPDPWRDPDLVAEETRVRLEDEDLLAYFRQRVRGAETMSDLDRIFDSPFEGFPVGQTRPNPS